MASRRFQQQHTHTHTHCHVYAMQASTSATLCRQQNLYCEFANRKAPNTDKHTHTHSKGGETGDTGKCKQKTKTQKRRRFQEPMNLVKGAPGMPERKSVCVCVSISVSVSVSVCVWINSICIKTQLILEFNLAVDVHFGCHAFNRCLCAKWQSRHPKLSHSLSFSLSLFVPTLTLANEQNKSCNACIANP